MHAQVHSPKNRAARSTRSRLCDVQFAYESENLSRSLCVCLCAKACCDARERQRACGMWCWRQPQAACRRARIWAFDGRARACFVMQISAWQSRMEDFVEDELLHCFQPLGRETESESALNQRARRAQLALGRAESDGSAVAGSADLGLDFRFSYTGVFAAQTKRDERIRMHVNIHMYVPPIYAILYTSLASNRANPANFLAFANSHAQAHGCTVYSFKRKSLQTHLHFAYSTHSTTHTPHNAYSLKTPLSVCLAFPRTVYQGDNHDKRQCG